ncbi:MAG: hypothetical protein RIT18_1123, partial [Actinomycetota bacterium]
MTTLKIKHVRVVGTGLIGTSIALGLASRGVSIDLHDEDPETLKLARDLLAPHLAEVSPDLVVIATPPQST